MQEIWINSLSSSQFQLLVLSEGVTVVSFGVAREEDEGISDRGRHSMTIVASQNGNKQRCILV